LTGERSRGVCNLLIDKRWDHRQDVGKFCFGAKPPNGLRRGNAQTVLLKEQYQCDHGPEDNRLRPGKLPEAKQRVSKKQLGTGHKARGS
jgi:hypothetical protein